MYVVCSLYSLSCHYCEHGNLLIYILSKYQQIEKSHGKKHWTIRVDSNVEQEPKNQIKCIVFLFTINDKIEIWVQKRVLSV